MTLRPQDLVVEVRDATLRRRAVVKPEHLNLKATLRDGAPSDWTLTVPNDHLAAPYLREPGGGIVVSHRDRTVPTLLSGPAIPVEDNRNADAPGGMLTVSGTSDDALLWWRTAMPTPTADPGDQADAYHVIAGPAETRARGYVLANMGPLAWEERAIPGLTATEDLGRGPVATTSARWDNLGELLLGILTPAGMRFGIRQAGDHLEFWQAPRRDVSGLVRLDMGNGTLASIAAAVTPPELTHVYVQGQGDLAARTVRARSTDAGDPWGIWGRREGVLDQRQTDDPAALDLAGDKALVDAMGGASVTAVPGDTQTMRWPTDWDRGDLVGLVIGRTAARATVSEVLLSATSDGVRVGASIGRPQGWTPNAALERRQAALEARLAALERLTPALP